MAGEKEILKTCICCGREFVPTNKQNTCCRNEECVKYRSRLKMERHREKRKLRPEMIRTRTKEPTVDTICPKDCRFRELLGGNTYYCNYGQVAHEEGKIGKPARGGTIENCTVYEPGRHKRRAVQLPNKEGRKWF